MLIGTFSGETARATYTVVEGSGADDLGDLSGQGGLEAHLGEDATNSIQRVNMTFFARPDTRGVLCFT